MSLKTIPFTQKQLEQIIEKYPTPFHIYDESGMRAAAKRLTQAFSWIDGFKEYFAVKATPNPHIMTVLKQEGFGADCSSLPELLLAEKIGLRGEEIMFTSNNTPADEYRKARELGAIINLDDISHIEFLEQAAGLPELICFRYNPGPLKKGNAIIGSPEEAKYGLTRQQLFEAYRICKEKGVKRFGLHTMVASNELSSEYFVETAKILFELIIELSREVGITFDFINIGGGFGVAYRPEQESADFEKISQGIKRVYEEIIVKSGMPKLRVVMENGRIITGPYGYLVTKAIHHKNIYKNYIGVDASMANLMRPALYGAYHHISVIGKENLPLDHIYDVVGSLCENNDKFAIDRQLPEIVEGDILVIHDSGAHGHSMGFNYNGKLRSAELLLRENGETIMIRRAETVEDYFATLDFSKII